MKGDSGNVGEMEDTPTETYQSLHRIEPQIPIGSKSASDEASAVSVTLNSGRGKHRLLNDERQGFFEGQGTRDP